MSVKLKEIRTLVRCGDFASADLLAHEVMLTEAHTPELFDLMGVIQANLGRTDQAGQYFAEAQRLDPENPDYILHAANLAEAQGNHRQAIAEYKRLLPLCVARKSIGAIYKLPSFQLRGDELPYLNPSFSIGGEDLILRKLFKDKLRRKIPGFYVDIGAASTVLASNTYLFYCHGWRGICVDANPATAETFQIIRPHDIYFNCAVTPDTGEVFFAAHKSENAGLARVATSPDAFSSEFQTPVKINSRPLGSILKEAVPDGVEIDFMSIDVEGSELGVINSNDWEKYAPRIIVLEDTAFQRDGANRSAAVDRLASLGYAVIGWAAPNVYLEIRNRPTASRA